MNASALATAYPNLQQLLEAGYSKYELKLSMYGPSIYAAVEDKDGTVLVEAFGVTIETALVELNSKTAV